MRSKDYGDYKLSVTEEVPTEKWKVGLVYDAGPHFSIFFPARIQEKRMSYYIPFLYNNKRIYLNSL